MTWNLEGEARELIARIKKNTPIPRGEKGRKLKQDINLEALEILRDCDVPPAVVELFDELIGAGAVFARWWQEDYPKASAWGDVLSYLIDNPKASNLRLAKVFVQSLGGAPRDPANYTDQVATRRRSANWQRAIARYS